MNGFLSAQYEPGNWILGYSSRQLYLNREMIYKYGFNLAEVQARAAAFAPAVPGRIRRADLDRSAERRVRERIRRKNSEQFLPEAVGRRCDQLDAGLDRTARARRIVVRIAL